MGGAYLFSYTLCRLLDWRERRKSSETDVRRNKYDKIIIFKHLFDPKEFEVILSPPSLPLPPPLLCFLPPPSLPLSLPFLPSCPPLPSVHALQEDATLINDIRDDLREECEKFGVVKKVLLFDVRLLCLSWSANDGVPSLTHTHTEAS